MVDEERPPYNGENVRIFIDPQNSECHDVWVWPRGEKVPCLHYHLHSGELDRLASMGTTELRAELLRINKTATEYLNFYRFSMWEMSLMLGKTAEDREDKKKRSAEKGLAVKTGE